MVVVSQGNGARVEDLGVVEEKNVGELVVVVDGKKGELEVGEENVVAELPLAGDEGDEDDVLWEQAQGQGEDDVQNDVEYV